MSIAKIGLWIGLGIAISSALIGTSRAQEPQPNATEAIAKQIGWLVIQNANLQAQIEELKKKAAACDKPKEDQK